MIERVARRAVLAATIWGRYVMVKLLLSRRLTLPETLDRLRARRPTDPGRQQPRQLGRSIVRALSVGPAQPRCLTMALIHYSMLNEGSEPPQLVIGLPAQAASRRAHAWIEIAGEDVGPPPGQHGHEEMARFE